MVTRNIVCACEDVTLSDVRAAIAAGLTDIESIKRYTGIGTGLCQGAGCALRVARELSQAGIVPARLSPFTARPPVYPVELSKLASLGAPAQSGNHQAEYPPLPSPPDSLPPLPEQVGCVIIGGGIMGLATAYHLCRAGFGEVLVVERGYLCCGASGRNGGGIRAQWSTPENVELMRESIAICRDFARNMGINVWLRQGGYLFLAKDDTQLAALERSVAMQRQHGLRTEMVSPERAGSIVPELCCDDLIGASFNPDDGVLFPWPFLWGYGQGAKDAGAEIATFTRVCGIEQSAGRVSAVVTDRGRVQCDLVLNAAGAWSLEVGRLGGVSLPNKPERHEIMVTESLRPFLGPLVSEIGTGLYFSQSLRGEIVGGISDSSAPAGEIDMRSSLRFAARMARALSSRVPRLGGVRMLRQWAGCYDLSPDGRPLIGEVRQPKGFFQLNGFGGHGFMMAPVVARIVAEYLQSGKSHPLLSSSRPDRFAEDGTADWEDVETMVIG